MSVRRCWRLSALVVATCLVSSVQGQALNDIARGELRATDNASGPSSESDPSGEICWKYVAWILACSLVGGSLPGVIVVYWLFRRRLRGQIVAAKLSELGLEREYLRVFHPEHWLRVRTQSDGVIQETFGSVFNTPRG